MVEILNLALPFFGLIFLVVAAASVEKLVDLPYVSATSAVSAAGYGNVGYMGLPLAVAFFGPE
jgi:malonate transporter and related proteins